MPTSRLIGSGVVNSNKSHYIKKINYCSFSFVIQELLIQFLIGEVHDHKDYLLRSLKGTLK